MGVDLRAFDRATRSFAQTTLPRAVQNVTQNLAREALTGIVNLTPVKSGRARGNWQVSIANPTTQEVDRLDPVGKTTIDEGLAEIASAAPFQSIWITNNVPYIGRLEHGHSKQAPSGMVATTLNRLKGVLK